MQKIFRNDAKYFQFYCQSNLGVKTMEVLKEKLLKEISDFCNHNTSEWEVSITEQEPYRIYTRNKNKVYFTWTLSVSRKDPQNQKNNRTYDISMRYDNISIQYCTQAPVETSLFFFCKIRGHLGVASLTMDSDLSGLDWEFLGYDRDNLLMPEISKIMAIILNFFEPEKKSEVAINELVSKAMS